MTTPGYGGSGQSRPQSTSAGRVGGEPVNQPGQYPASLFGVALPQGTGAAGSAGPALYSGDVTNQPGQLNEGLSGLGPADIAQTGAPGSMGAQNTAGGTDQVTYTRPGSYATGSYEMDTLSDSVSGVNDWTQAIDGSYGGQHPQIPGLSEPTSTGAGQGRIMYGGRNPDAGQQG